MLSNEKHFTHITNYTVHRRFPSSFSTTFIQFPSLRAPRTDQDPSSSDDQRQHGVMKQDITRCSSYKQSQQVRFLLSWLLRQKKKSGLFLHILLKIKTLFNNLTFRSFCWISAFLAEQEILPLKVPPTAVDWQVYLDRLKQGRFVSACVVVRGCEMIAISDLISVRQNWTRFGTRHTVQVHQNYLVFF